MKHNCPNSNCKSTHIVKDGTYFRKCDSRYIQKLLCKECGKKFSYATRSSAYMQKNRRVNYLIYELLAAGNSQNQIARMLHINRKTVARKLIYLGQLYKGKNQKLAKGLKGKVDHIQFDELITFEHTKCKPLSIAVAVQKKTRYFLGFQVSKIPANGLLAEISVRKYGKRVNHRERGLNRLFRDIKALSHSKTQWESDEYPTYRRELLKVITPERTEKPHSVTIFSIEKPLVSHNEKAPIKYRQFKGIKGSITGQGELKKAVYDPLFAINHTLAMLRAKINRLFRKTWNTTKKIQGLENHLHIYMHYHNTRIIKLH